jgi:phage terminase large subunit-like protein
MTVTDTVPLPAAAAQPGPARAMWDLSCPDWQERIRDGRSLLPDMPLNDEEADLGLAMFDEFRLPDVPGLPMLGDAAGQWFRDLVRVTLRILVPQTSARATSATSSALAPEGAIENLL